MTGTTPALHPKRTALLVMDYQPVVLSAFPDADTLVARLADTVTLVRDQGGHVGYVRVAFAAADYAVIPTTNKAFSPLVEGGFLHHEDPAAAFHAALTPQDGDISIRKTRTGAFSTSDLDHQLRDRGITTLVLAGIYTSGVLLSTVRDAADRDYQIFVLADGSADPDTDVHDMLMHKVFPRHAHVITTADLPTLLASPESV